MRGFYVICAVLAAAAGEAWADDLPPDLQDPGATPVFTAHAVGAQIYECKAGENGKLAWTFREPIAALLQDGKTVGRHYAGPTWEIGGGAIVAKPVGKAPGSSAEDIAWLKLKVVDKRGEGPLTSSTIVRRLNTRGGVLQGACAKAGDLVAAPYAADYQFLRN